MSDTDISNLRQIALNASLALSMGMPERSTEDVVKTAQTFLGFLIGEQVSVAGLDKAANTADRCAARLTQS